MAPINNIYISSLEFGAKHFPDGISYNQLLAHLDSLEKKPIGEFEEYFQQWFFKNFFEFNTFRNLNQPQSGGIAHKSNYISLYDKKLVMTADAYFKYQDHLLLLQTRKDAKSAHNLSLLAIIISAFLTFVQILIAICDR